MPRPCKKRRICEEPSYVHFGPSGKKTEEEVVMTLDEFECIRLIDYENLTQENCASQMNVARTTIQAIYSSARKKIAECLVTGKTLHIDGGNYTLCEKKNGCSRSHCINGGPNTECSHYGVSCKGKNCEKCSSAACN